MMTAEACAENACWEREWKRECVICGCLHTDVENSPLYERHFRPIERYERAVRPMKGSAPLREAVAQPQRGQRDRRVAGQ